MESRPDSAINFFNGASEALLRLLDNLGDEQLIQPGKTLMVQGDEGDTFYFVLSGAFEVSITSTEGRKLSLNVAHKGDVLGEIALFDPGPRTATVTARELSRIRGIKNADVMAALSQTPDLSRELIQLAGARMRQMNQQLNEQVFLPLPPRLARKILQLTAHDPDRKPLLALSQLELAEFVGASREAVSKTLSGWTKDGHIKLSRGSLRVLEKDALQELADYSLF
ncbi:MAG: Crp/Fnr family transcriptional regulator [Pseudomonadota bacterium]